MGLLYGVAYTIKMSKHKLEGYFDYVVPPLEGIWWQENTLGVDYTQKQNFKRVSMIRLPEFVGRKAFNWAIWEATQKKQQDFSKVAFFYWEEGLFIQCMHIGLYDAEPTTVAAMKNIPNPRAMRRTLEKAGFHHEIYISDVRRCKPERLKTVIRQPVRRMGL